MVTTDIIHVSTNKNENTGSFSTTFHIFLSSFPPLVSAAKNRREQETLEEFLRSEGELRAGGWGGWWPLVLMGGVGNGGSGGGVAHRVAVA